MLEISHFGMLILDHVGPTWRLESKLAGYDGIGYGSTSLNIYGVFFAGICNKTKSDLDFNDTNP